MDERTKRALQILSDATQPNVRLTREDYVQVQAALQHIQTILEGVDSDKSTVA